MTRAALPVQSMAIVDAENSSTVQFNAWLSGIDDAVTGVGMREPLPPDAIVAARQPTIPFLKWLKWVDRSVVAVTARKASLPLGFAIVGQDMKATIPFYAWCRWIDGALP